ncbi:DUF3857 domain-containing protein [Polaribacter sp. P097]|uniref:DUF3857 domain-containing protein n=1 Tax=Polaribacter sp. P097 TaxID=3117398 RepID=UPI002FDFF38A
MIKKIIFGLILISQVSFHAQNYEFGKVSKDELQEEFYPLDSTADAAYLYKKRKTYFNYGNNTGFEVINEVYLRVKLYTKEGFDFATFKLPYVRPESGKSERISSIKAVTYNLNEKGKIVEDKVSKKYIFDETTSKFRHVKRITFPNLKEGSVIELKYTMTSPYTEIVDDLQFQYGIPVKKLSIEVETPEWLIFAKKNKGYYLISPVETVRNGSITIRNKVRTITREAGPGGTTVGSTYDNNEIDMAFNSSTYKAENIPALKDNEPYVGSAYAYRGGVKYELVGTKFPNSIPKSFSKSWDDVTKQIYKSDAFGKELEKTNYYKKDIDALIANSNVNLEKLAMIFQYVKSNIKWNGYTSKYTNDGVRKAYLDKTGNSAEINLMLTSMLRYAGLNANPVLVSSKGNGVPLFPTIKGFDYVVSGIKLADNSMVLLDATEPYSMPNQLPARALNWNGRLVTKTGESTWVNLNSSKHAAEENMIMVKISDELEVTGFTRTIFDNFDAQRFRIRYNHIKDEDLIERFEENNNLEVDDFKLVNQDNLAKPVVRNVKFTSEDLLETIGNKLYIEPSLFLTKRSNPFKLEERKYPVDFTSAFKETNKVTIQIPNGYAIETVPEQLAIALPDNLGFFKYQVINGGNKIKLVSLLQVNSSMVPPQYYQALKDFYSKLVKKETEKIVLVKS